MPQTHHDPDRPWWYEALDPTHHTSRNAAPARAAAGAADADVAAAASRGPDSHCLGAFDIDELAHTAADPDRWGIDEVEAPDVGWSDPGWEAGR